MDLNYGDSSVGLDIMKAVRGVLRFPKDLVDDDSVSITADLWMSLLESMSLHR